MTSFTPPGPLDTPVLFLVFNRPEPTAQVFEAIRQARPPRLYVGADGARDNRKHEAERVANVRRIATAVDWPCEVKTLYRDRNLGCRDAVSSAISWFFENEEAGIILEDDCLPTQSFFWFCEAMLERYRDDTRIWQVSGTTFYPTALTHMDADYFYSRYGPIWGWATWRRAWTTHYDPDLRNWPQMSKPSALEQAYPFPPEARSKAILGQRLYDRDLDTWDYQWAIIKAYNSALTVTPAQNMIVNIGFADDATHTNKKPVDAPTTFHDICFPTRAPTFLLRDRQHDEIYARRKFRATGLIQRMKTRLKSKIAIKWRASA